MPTYTQANRAVRIDTPFGTDVLLLKNFRGTESLGRPFQYELVLFSEDPELDYEKIIGQKVTITVDTTAHAGDGSAVTRYFHGFVSRFAQTNYEGNLAEYRATVVPWLWFLTRSANCRIFQNQKVPDIITQIFQDFGFSDVINQLHGTYRTQSYCVQYRETAFNFVSRLMEEEGIYYFFQHENGKHSIVLCDSPASHEEFPGYTDLLYRPASDGVQETLHTWSVQHEVQSDAYSTTNFNFTAPKTYALSSSFEPRSYGPVQLEQFDYLGEQSEYDQYSTGAKNENDRYSLMRLQELQARFETYASEGDARGVATGSKFTLTGHPRQAFGQAYLTTGADYHIDGNAFATADEYGQEFQFQVKLAAMVLTVPFRSPRVTPKPIVHGPQTATVVGPSGETISTDEYGQVKVQFHWDRLGQNDQNSSCYMRVSQAWASKSWGDLAIPHVGDEVIVECLEGDPDRPIITGRVYNNANMPPMALPANKNKRIWNDSFGNELLFDATPGEEHILLRSPQNTSGLTLGQSSSNFTEANNTAVTLGSSATMTVGDSLALTTGGAFGAVVGVNVAAVMGLNGSINIGPQMGITLGPQFTITKGLKYDMSADDDFKIVDKNYVISAGKVLNLVGGSGPEDGSAVVYGDDFYLEMSVGKAVTVTPPTRATSVKALNIASAVLFVVAAGTMAGTAGYVDSYNPDPDTPTDAADDSDDAHTQRESSSLNSQTAIEVASGVAFAAAIACAAASYGLARTETAEVELSRHLLGEYTARFVLNREAKVAFVEGLTESALLAGPGGDAGFVSANTEAVDIKHSLAFNLEVAPNKISVAPSGITIGGPSIKITGADIDIGGGAVTILGVPQPVPPTLAADAATRVATEAPKVASYAAVIAEMTARKFLNLAISDT